MSKLIAIIVGFLLLASLVLFTTTYTVSFHEVVIKSRFGQTNENSVVRGETDAGLHFKLPFFIDRTVNFDTRLQLLESPLETIQTADGQQLVVRAFLMWQIDTEDDDGPLAFASSYESIEKADRLLLDELRDSLSVLSKYSFDELIGGREGHLAKAEAALLNQMMSVRSKGVLPVTAGVSQLLLPPKTTTAVLSRMYQTRQNLAEAERFKGQAEAERITSEARTMADTIRAFAELRAEEIRAEGNEKAREYLEKLREDEEFAIYLVHLDALAQMLDKTTTLVVPTNLAPFDLMNLEGVSWAQPARPVSEAPDGGAADEPVAEAASETEPS